MNWLDLGIVIFLVVFIIIGIKRGLMSSVLSNFSFSINCLFSMFLSHPIAFIFNKLFKIGPSIQSHYYNSFLAKTNNSYLFTNLVDVYANDGASVLKDTVSTAINEADLGGIQKTMFKTFLNKKNLGETLTNAGYESRTVADIISQTYANFFVTIISFVTAVAILSLLVFLFKKLADKLRTVGFVKGVDNTFGAFYGVFRCFIALVIICCVIKLLSPFAFMTGVINYINGSLFGRLLYGWINTFINNYLSFSDIVSSIFN